MLKTTDVAHPLCPPFLGLDSQLMYWFLPLWETVHFPSNKFIQSLYLKHWLSFTLHIVAKHQVWNPQASEGYHLTWCFARGSFGGMVDAAITQWPLCKNSHLGKQSTFLPWRSSLCSQPLLSWLILWMILSWPEWGYMYAEEKLP